MKRFSIPQSVALAALSLLTAVTPAHAGKRPIQAEGRGIFLFNDDSAQLAGSGKGQHLGGCVLLIYLDFDELANFGHLVPHALLLEAANGDRLSATVDAEFNPATGIIAGTITFRGGTGRFADAMGSASLLIAPDVPNWFGPQFSWALKGTIDY